MFKNDERYWDINLLNKWFAISSVVFLITMVWTFIDDNDDEFKEYQREFRKLEIEKAEEKLTQEKSSIEGEVEDYDKLLAEAENEYSKKSQDVEKINEELGDLRASVYKVNLKYSEQKAKLDVLKFQLESANLEGGDKSAVVRKSYKDKLSLFNKIKLQKEDFELKISSLEKEQKKLKSDVKDANDRRDKFLKKVYLAENKLN